MRKKYLTIRQLKFFLKISLEEQAGNISIHLPLSQKCTEKDEKEIEAVTVFVRKRRHGSKAENMKTELTNPIIAFLYKTNSDLFDIQRFLKLLSM